MHFCKERKLFFKYGIEFSAVKESKKVNVQTFDMPEKKQWLNYTFGEKGDKVVSEQRKEILDAMTRAMNTEVAWKEITAYNPTIAKYSHIKAITYDGLEYKGGKTKVFAYTGFPEGAETVFAEVILGRS